MDGVSAQPPLFHSMRVGGRVVDFFWSGPSSKRWRHGVTSTPALGLAPPCPNNKTLVPPVIRPVPRSTAIHMAWPWRIECCYRGDATSSCLARSRSASLPAPSLAVSVVWIFQVGAVISSAINTEFNARWHYTKLAYPHAVNCHEASCR